MVNFTLTVNVIAALQLRQSAGQTSQGFAQLTELFTADSLSGVLVLAEHQSQLLHVVLQPGVFHQFPLRSPTDLNILQRFLSVFDPVQLTVESDHLALHPPHEGVELHGGDLLLGRGGDHLGEGEGHQAQPREDVDCPAEAVVEEVETLLGHQDGGHQDQAGQQDLAQLGHVLQGRNIRSGRAYNSPYLGVGTDPLTAADIG